MKFMKIFPPKKKLIEYSNINFHENIAKKKILKAPRRWFAVEFSTLSAQQELFTRVEIIFLRFSILIHGKHATENFPPRYYNSTVINETQVTPSAAEEKCQIPRVFNKNLMLLEI